MNVPPGWWQAVPVAAKAPWDPALAMLNVVVALS
jgi:hypothetical protein